MGSLLMQIIQSRRHFLAGLSAAGVAGVLGTQRSLADEGPPEVTMIRIGKSTGICVAPSYIADDLLRLEGFTDIRSVPAAGGFTFAQMAGRGEIDFGITFAALLVFHMAAGIPVTALAGVHSGCYELFAHEPIKPSAISRAKGLAPRR
jgi:NitT/TauT family transport system substrate-binding protein